MGFIQGNLINQAGDFSTNNHDITTIGNFAFSMVIAPWARRRSVWAMISPFQMGLYRDHRDRDCGQ